MLHVFQRADYISMKNISLENSQSYHDSMISILVVFLSISSNLRASYSISESTVQFPCETFSELSTEESFTRHTTLAVCSDYDVDSLPLRSFPSIGLPRWMELNIFFPKHRTFCLITSDFCELRKNNLSFKRGFLRGPRNRGTGQNFDF